METATTKTMPRVYDKPSDPLRSERLRAALDYAAHGWPVLPCRAGGKEPLTPHGHLDASTDPRKITAWWHCWPNANIGIVTGERSGILALDVDHPLALDKLEQEHGSLPPTRTHSTGSAGMHILFRYPPGSGIRNSTGRLGKNLDTRGEGGYIVAPPSRTEGAYSVVDTLPLADTPAWLVDALTEPHNAGRSQKTAPALDRGAVVSLDSPGPIKQGRRDDTLTRIAGRLHDGSRSLEGLTADLLAVNAERCEPPLPERQVQKIARSIHGLELARSTAPTVTPEVRGALELVEAELWRRAWPGMGGKSERDAVIALIRLARKVGTLIPAGVRVGVSVRAWALEAAVSKRAMLDYRRGGEMKPGIISRLKLAGMIRSDSFDRHDGKAGAFVLLLPRAEFHHSSTGGVLRTTEETSGETLRSPRLRWGAPEIRRLGKGRGVVIDALELYGGTMPLDALADALAVKRLRDLRRRVLPPLVEAGVVECFGNTVALTSDWREALDRDRERAGEIAAERRDREKYERESRAYRERRNVQPSPHIANASRGLIADGAIAELEPVPDVRDLYPMIGRHVETSRGPGELWDVKGLEARVILDATPDVWTPLDVSELIGEGAA